MLKRFFRNYEDDCVEFKVKIDLEIIMSTCFGGKAYGYWKFKSDFFWKSLGQVAEGNSRDWATKEFAHKNMPEFLALTQEAFFKQMANGHKVFNLSSISIVEAEQGIEKETQRNRRLLAIVQT